MTKTCDQCGKVYHRQPKMSPAIWERRLYCGIKCAVHARFWVEHGFTLERVKRALQYDPDLEIWQIAERFGVHESTAEDWRARYRPAARLSA